MGEGDPRAVCARLPGSVLQATADPAGGRPLSLLPLRYGSSFLRRGPATPLQPRRGTRDPRGVGGTLDRLPAAAASRPSGAPLQPRVGKYAEPLRGLPGAF